MNTAIGITIISFVLPSATCDFRMSSKDKGLLTAAPMLGTYTRRIYYKKRKNIKNSIQIRPNNGQFIAMSQPNNKHSVLCVCYVRLLFVRHAGMLFGSYFWGCLADTKGRKVVLVATLLLDGFCGLLSSIAQYYSLFMFFRFFNGFG